ncbi:MAG: AsmA family protein, partial [Gammaproteobacteria bacterium]|nr:AsmA family protein [Gammaproteobacteria bacterium]
PGGRLVLSLRADYGDLPVKLDGKVGAAGAIRRNQPFEVDLEGAVGTAEFSIRGAVGKALEGKDLRLDVALNSESTKKISDLAGVKMEEFGPLDVKFRLLEQGGYFHLESLAATARPRDTDASIRAAVKNFAFDLASGTAGAAAQGAPMTVDLDLAFGDARLHVDGDVGKPLEGRDLRLGTRFETPSTIPLTALAGFDFEEVGPVNLTLTLVERDGNYDFDDIALTARPRGSDASLNGSVKGFVPDLDGSKAQPEAAKVEVTGAVGGAEFSITGDIGNPMEGKDLRLNVALAAKSSVPLSELAGVDVEEVGPLNVKLTVIEKNGRFDLGNINMTAQPRHAHVTIKGSVIDIVDNPQPNLDVALSANTLRQLDEALPDVGPVQVSAKVQPSGKVMDIQDLIATVGKSDLSGSASVDIGAERPSVSAKLQARVIDLAQFLPPAEESGAGAAAASDGRVFSDDPLPFGALEKFNGDIELAVDRLITRKLALDKVNVVARLENGDLNIKPTANISGGTVGATIHIDTRTQPTTLAVDVDAKKVSIGALTKQIRGYETSKGLDSNLLMKLRGQGDSVRALMGGLDGDVQLEIGEGQLSNDALDRVGADLMTKIIGVAVPTDDKDGTTRLNCGVFRFAIQDGDAIADQTLVLETEKVLLQGGGLVDLKTEELDLGAKLAARKGIRLGAGTLSSLARVQGTLAEPELGTDLKGVVKAGAKVGIAVVTVGLSLVAESVYGHISEDDHPCQTALAREIEITPTEYKAQKSE